MSIQKRKERAEALLRRTQYGKENPRPSRVMELDRQIYHDFNVWEKQTGRTWAGNYICQAVSFTLHELIIVSSEYKKKLYSATDKQKLSLRCKFCDLLKALINLLGALEFSVEDDK